MKLVVSPKAWEDSASIRRDPNVIGVFVSGPPQNGKHFFFKDLRKPGAETLRTESNTRYHVKHYLKESGTYVVGAVTTPSNNRVLEVLRRPVNKLVNLSRKNMKASLAVIVSAINMGKQRR